MGRLRISGIMAIKKKKTRITRAGTRKENVKIII